MLVPLCNLLNPFEFYLKYITFKRYFHYVDANKKYMTEWILSREKFPIIQQNVARCTSLFQTSHINLITFNFLSFW